MKTVKYLTLVFLIIMIFCAIGCTKINRGDASPEPSEEVSVKPSATAEPTATPEPTERLSENWTIMIYMCGSDLESEGGEATKNLESLLAVNVPASVNILLYTGGTAKWQNNVIGSDSNAIWRVKDGGLEQLDSTEPQSMGERATLAGFISYAQTNYPSDKKALFFWNHGAGSITGFGADELFEYDSLSLPELSEAFAQSSDGQKFELIGFDACLMASIETASVLEPYAKYMVASEEVEPGGGWDYEYSFGQLAQDPVMNGEKFGVAITDGYWGKYQNSEEGGFITCSVTDLSKIPALEQLLGTYAKDLSGNITATGSMSMLSKARLNAESYGDEPGTESLDTVDLYSFIDLQTGIDDKLCDEMLAAIKSAVTYEKSGNLRAYSNGLSVFFPFESKESFDASLQVYAAIDFCPEYEDFAAQFASVLTNEDFESAVPDYSGEIYDESTGAALEDDQNYDEIGSYYVQLTDEEMEYMSYVYCTLGWYMDDGTLIDLGFDSDLTINYDDNTFHDNFGGWWTGLNGQPVAVYVMEETDDYLIYNIPVEYNGEMAVIKGSWVWDSTNEEGGYYTYGGIYYAADQYAIPNTKLSIDLKPGDEITPMYPTLSSPDGYTGYYVGDTFKVDESGLSLGLIWLPGGSYQYGFMFIDCYGNTQYSDTIDFDLSDTEG